MSDTYSEDDRKPTAVEYREPRDVEKGEGGGGGVKLPPSANMATVTSLRETIALQMMVTTKRLPLPILSARHMHPHPRHLILRQNLFLWPTTRNLHTSHPK